MQGSPGTRGPALRHHRAHHHKAADKDEQDGERRPHEATGCPAATTLRIGAGLRGHPVPLVARRPRLGYGHPVPLGPTARRARTPGPLVRARTSTTSREARTEPTPTGDPAHV
ncbi:hypothetical protein OG897_17875 [Streptomyces sp. NBC_00237]|uniref:hypothetical protein n=1 Tax=Streptomyces sp. NBC_00237 TaxID=2975687 RepID=UPI00225AA649|nr:hypothetical protein [Streptomyces sp. NBC_00237]MCX5203307.1 hypothetical protein [Streptomyces sp. NBC_00237]